MRYVARLLFLILVVGGLLIEPATPAAQNGISVLLPLHGIDAAEGIEDAAAARIALAGASTAQTMSIRDISHGEVQNPHEDEGTDNDRDVTGAQRLVRDIGTRADVFVGGSRPNVTDAIASADRFVPFIAMRAARHTDVTFCLCRNPVAVRRAFVDVARRRFGARLLVFTRVASSSGELRLNGSVQTGDAWRVALRRMRFDAVVLDRGDGRFVAERAPATPIFDRSYLIALGHRDAPARPPGADDALASAPYALVHTAAEREFERAFHRAYGAMPFAEAAYAYAATQVAIGATRRATGGHVLAILRRQTFRTILGSVRFDVDGYWTAAPLSICMPRGPYVACAP